MLFLGQNLALLLRQMVGGGWKAGLGLFGSWEEAGHVHRHPLLKKNAAMQLILRKFNKEDN
jgi:hypothetical protein